MTTELEILPDIDRTPTTLFASPDPAAIIQKATRIADPLARIITDRHLYAPISGKKYPTLEAWTLLGMLLPTTVSPHVTRTWQTENGWGAHAEARTLDGQVVSAADAYCMRDEEKWEHKPNHQVASMASTRACSRAMRLPLSFVMSLTGYEVTPAEEMEAAARGETVTGGRGVQMGWKDIQQQQRAHAKMGERIDEHGLREWVVEWCDSKGYTRPMSRPQFLELERAITRELEDQKSDPVPLAPPGPGSDPTSEAGSSGVSGDGASSPASDVNPTRNDREDGDALPVGDDGEGSVDVGGDTPTSTAAVANADPTPPNSTRQRRPGSR